MTLRDKTTALLAILVTLALSISGLVFLHYQQQALKASISQGAEGMANTAAQAISTFLQNAAHDAQSIASTLPLDAYQNKDLARIENHLVAMLALNPQFENGLFVLDKEGKFVADYPSHPELHGKSFAHRDYYRRTLSSGNNTMGTPYHSARTGKPVLTFTGVIRNRDREIVGIVGCSIDLMSPSALGNLRMQRLGETGYLYLIDRSRLMIMHPDDSRVLKRDVPQGANSLLDAALKGFEGVGETMDGPNGVNAHFTGFEGAGDTVNSRGVPMLLALKRVPNTDWILGVQQTQSEAYRPLSETQWRIVLITLLSLLFATLLGNFMVKYITRPLVKLRQATTHIGHELSLRSGQFNSAATLELLRDINSDDEIGSLAISFSRLMEQLDLALAASQKAAQDWARTFDSVHEAVFILDKSYRILRLNKVAADWFKLNQELIEGGDCQQLVFNTATPPVDWDNIPRLREGQHVNAVFDNARVPGVFELRASPILDAGQTVGAVLILRDITEARRAEQRIHELAFFDALTGLPNRPLLMDRMQQALALAGRCQQRFGVLFLDLDHFKEVNDTLGHECGDELLKLVAHRLSNCLRQNDSVARLGGDEFVLLVLDIIDAEGAATVAKKILQSIPLPYKINDHEVLVTSSIGIALYPDDGKDISALLRNADQAMYAAKQHGRNTYEFFITGAGTLRQDRRN